MTKALGEVLDIIPQDERSFQCDAVIIIGVRRNPDGSWQPCVLSNADNFTPEELAKMCLFAAEDIYKKGVLKTEGSA